MNTIYKKMITITAILGFGLVVGVIYAQQGPMVNGMRNGMEHGMASSVRHGQMMFDQSGVSQMKVMRELMSPSERIEMMDKMIDAKTVEEREQLMATQHLEMDKRAKAKGLTLPLGFGPKMMSGKYCG